MQPGDLSLLIPNLPTFPKQLLFSGKSQFRMNIHELTTSKYFFLLQLWIKPLRGRAKYLTTMRNILFSSFQDAMICKEKRLGALHLTKSPRRFSCCGFKESRPHLYPTIHLFTFKNVTQRSDIGTTFAICYRIGRGSFVNLI